MAKLTIDERLALLEEAELFFADLSDAGGEAENLGRKKAAALSTVNICLRYYKEKVLDDKEWTEDDLKEAMELSIREDTINDMIKKKEMEGLEADFYRGGFGMAIGILEGDEETIKGLRQLQSQYDNIVNSKLQNKSIGDLLK